MSLNLVKSTDIYYQTTKRKISLYTGDLAALDAEDGVDYLGVSALPHDYSPTGASLIQALRLHGISVADLSKQKLADYRADIPCWISRVVPNANFKHIVVFEPSIPFIPAEDLITYIFSAISTIQGSNSAPICLALPLVCTQTGKADERDMMDAIFFAAAHWCGMKFPFSEVKLTLYHTKLSTSKLAAHFSSLIQQYTDIETIDISNYNSYARLAHDLITQIPPPLPYSLNYRQAFAICLYTTNFYYFINSTLRSNDKKSEEYKKLRPLFEAIDTGLMNITDFIYAAYRGESNMTQDRLKRNEKGKTVKNLAYFSTCSEPSSYYNKSHFRFKLQSLTGSLVEDVSAFPHEHEVLFMEGMQYYVKNVLHPSYYQFNCDEVAEKYRR
jgi:hypothetical protein